MRHLSLRSIRPLAGHLVQAAAPGLALATAWFAALVLAVAPSAQCTPTFTPGLLPGVSGTVYTTILWDADGPGPLPELLIVGGDFQFAGDAQSRHIAGLDLATGMWSSLGTGMDGPVRALARLPNGELVAAGHFLHAGGVAAARIARWNGASWSPIGNGMNAEVLSLCTRPNGELIAAGSFTTASGVAANHIASWNGSAWSALGSGTNSGVRAVVTLPSGDVVAGGSFTQAGGVAVWFAARWNGSTWSGLGSGFAGTLSNTVHTLAVAPNGTLYAGGVFAGGTAQWSGSGWIPLPFGPLFTVQSMVVHQNGDLLVYGLGGYGVPGFWRWNGSWTSLLFVFPQGNAFALQPLANGDVVLAGDLRVGGGISLTRWNGSTFSPVCAGFDASVRAISTRPDGRLFAAGAFVHAPGGAASCIAQWDGSNWSAVGTGVDNRVDALTTLPNGDVIAGGVFTHAGGAPASHVARWDGTAWSSLGVGLPNPVTSLATLPGGEPVAAHYSGGSSMQVVRWDGSNWLPLGAPFDNAIWALATLPNGEVIAGGAFSNAGGVPATGIARWNGIAWAPLGAGIGTGLSLAPLVDCILVEPNGDLIVGGDFDTAGGIPALHVARWNGSSWSALGSGPAGPVRDLCHLPNGDLLAVGMFTQANGQPANNMARWNGSTWNAVGAGLDLEALAVVRMPDDEVVISGNFMTAGGHPSPFLTRLSTSCPATATPFGSGCTGSGGTNVFRTTARPWLGATYRGEATGMPSNGFVAAVTGFTPLAIPLQLVLPSALPGCQGLVSGDYIEVMLPTGGEARTQLPIPANAALVGLVFHQYVIAFEIVGGQIGPITNSNAMALQIGAF